MPPEPHKYELRKNDTLQLCQFWSTLLFPAIIGKLVILIKYVSKIISAGDLKKCYQIVSLGQIVLAHIYLGMVFGLYKSFLINVVDKITEKNDSKIFEFTVTELMYFYSFALTSAGFLVLI